MRAFGIRPCPRMEKIAPAFRRKAELLATLCLAEGPEACNRHPMQVHDLDVAGLAELATVGEVVPLPCEVVGHLRKDGHVLHLHSDHDWLVLLVVRESLSSQGCGDQNVGKVPSYFIHRYRMADDFRQLLHDIGILAVDVRTLDLIHELVERAGQWDWSGDGAGCYGGGWEPG